MNRLKFIKTIAKDLLRRYDKHQLKHISGSLAYFFTLAIFPLFIFIQAVLGLFGVGLSSFIETLQTVVPTNVYDLLNTYVQSISGENIGLLSFGLVSALYASSIALNSIMNAVLLAYNQTSRHSWFYNKALAILFTILLGGSMSLFLIVPVLGSLVLPMIKMYLPDLLALFNLINTLSWLVSAVAIVATLALLYKIVPQKPVKGSIWPGAIFALTGWLIGSSGFAFFVNNFANYSTYGFFGSVMVFLLWLYITGLMIILGAELNDSLDQHRLSKEKTEATD
jgi:membrane protein